MKDYESGCAQHDVHYGLCEEHRLNGIGGEKFRQQDDKRQQQDNRAPADRRPGYSW